MSVKLHVDTVYYRLPVSPDDYIVSIMSPAFFSSVMLQDLSQQGAHWVS